MSKSEKKTCEDITNNQWIKHRISRKWKCNE